MSPRFVADPAKLNEAVISGPQHLRPVFQAVRDRGVVFGIITQGAGRFRIPKDRPHIVLLGDDLEECLGPTAFDDGSLRRLFKQAHLIALVACEPVPSIYALAATVPGTVGGVVTRLNPEAKHRRHSVVIETRAEREADWFNFIQAAAPADTPKVLGLVRPHGTA